MAGKMRPPTSRHGPMIPLQKRLLLLLSSPRSRHSRNRIRVCGCRKIRLWASTTAGTPFRQPMPDNPSGMLAETWHLPTRISSSPSPIAMVFLLRPAPCQQRERSGRCRRAIYPRLSMYQTAPRVCHPIPISLPCSHHPATQASRQWEIQPSTKTSFPSLAPLSTAGNAIRSFAALDTVGELHFRAAMLAHFALA